MGNFFGGDGGEIGGGFSDEIAAWGLREVGAEAWKMMLRFGFLLAVLVMAAGCCQSVAEREAYASAPGFYVPGALMAANSQGQGINPYQVLPASDAEEDFIGRAEKFVYGGMPLSEYSAYSVYTYDAQRISSPRGVGYRYTYSVREGESFP